MVIAIGKRTPSEQLGHISGHRREWSFAGHAPPDSAGSAMTGDMQHLNVIVIVNRNGLNRAYSGHFRQRGRCANSDLRLTPMP